MTATLLEVRSVTEQDTLYRFFCPELASRARPGQFVEVLVSDGTDPFLRRPISIFDCDGRAEFSLLVRTVGRGTELMTRWTAGTEVDVLGPLGHGFTWAEADDVCTLVAGGVGVATMGYLARALLDAGKRVRLLFSPLRQARLLEVFPCGDRVEMICAGSRAELPAALEKALTGAAVRRRGRTLPDLHGAAHGLRHRALPGLRGGRPGRGAAGISESVQGRPCLCSGGGGLP